MTVIHYDVDKGLDLKNLIVIDVDEVLTLYVDKDNAEILLSDTIPEFLARFRRSDYNGSLISKNKLGQILIPVGNKLIIRKDGTVGILSDTGPYYEFCNNSDSWLEKRSFPGNEFGKFHSYTGMTMFNFNHFLDSFRVNHTLNVEEFESPWLIEDLYLLEEGAMSGIIEEALEDGSVDIYSMLDRDLIAKRDALHEEFARNAGDEGVIEYLETLDEAIDRFEAEMAARGLL